MENFDRKRNIVDNSKWLAFGCSHTWGVGVEADETWSYFLSAKNYGIIGCSADFIVRSAPEVIIEEQAEVVFVLWPDWTRFEYVQNNKYFQSVPTDSNRIYFMSTHDDAWCLENFQNKVTQFKNFCVENNVKLVDMSLYDLIPYMDHADRWPLSKLGHHYSPVWHQQVADIFLNALNNNIQHPIANE